MRKNISIRDDVTLGSDYISQHWGFKMFSGNNRIIVITCAIILMAVATLLVFSTLSARAADSIKLGAILSITGPGSFIGKQVRNGLVLAVDEINSYGGINGR